MSATSTSAISSSARLSTSEPLLARPIGLRVAATTTASLRSGMAVLLWSDVGDGTGAQPVRDVRGS